MSEAGDGAGAGELLRRYLAETLVVTERRLRVDAAPQAPPGTGNAVAGIDR